jgi:hypothetical protein
MERKREHLAQVDRHIAECEAHIARQREIIQDAVNRIMIFGPKGDGTHVVEFRAGRGRRFRGFAECEVT